MSETGIDITQDLSRRTPVLPNDRFLVVNGSTKELQYAEASDVGGGGGGGKNEGRWKVGNYKPSSYVLWDSQVNIGYDSKWYLIGDTDYYSTVQPHLDPDHWIEVPEVPGPMGSMPIHEWNGTMLRFELPDGSWGVYTNLQGAAGKEVQFQKTSTHIQWRYVGDPSWVNLVTLTDLKGDKGDRPDHSWSGTQIRFQLPNGSWGTYVDIKGAAGKEVQFQKTATHIQWRYVGDTSWINLVALADLKGDKGDSGSNGWYFVPGVVNDGDRRVLQVIDWQGGTGTKPAVGMYLGETGYVTNIALAKDFRGPQGAAGSGSGDMQAAIYDPTGKEADAFDYNNLNNKPTMPVVPDFGTTAGTMAQGNDSRINNGQTAFIWGNHSGKYTLTSYLSGRSISDINEIPKGFDVFYLSSSSPQKPSGMTDGIVVQFAYSDSYQLQLIADWRTNVWYVRNCNNGTWGNFETIFHSGNLRSNAQNDLRFEQLSRRNVANGYAGLNENGKILPSQLPAEVMTLEGSWNASTNTPALADGTGDPGEIYEVTVAGTRNLGSGDITFSVGDWVVYGANGKWYLSPNTHEVTGVKGSAESTYRKGNVNITAANVGAAVIGTAGTQVRNNTQLDSRYAQTTNLGTAASKNVGTTAGSVVEVLTGGKINPSLYDAGGAGFTGIITISGAHTLNSEDIGKYHRKTGGGPITLTIPTNAVDPIPVNTTFEMFITSGGVNLSTAGLTITRIGSGSIQAGPVSFVKTGTNSWDVIGG